MKKIVTPLIASILLVSTTASSIESSYYDTSTQILNIPNLAIKGNENNGNPSQKYKDTTLLLNLDGTWKILNLDTNPSFFYPEEKIVAGYWVGQSSSYPGNICMNGEPTAPFLRVGHYRISLMQHGDKLIGIVAGLEPCSADTIGKLTGKITGQEASFSIKFNGKEYVEFKGKIYNNFSKIEGEIEYKNPSASYAGEKESLSLLLH